ncbi:hypothetical protein R3P38DRAFT_2843910 [Favolaschia claudopus]|uniref:Uncharacterized protein n=1 Tax=Favolaschia claudopus TaxID=2862362 RepID=A0AAW0DYZ4_9AGAR
MHDLDAQRQGNPPPYDTPGEPDKLKAAPGRAERQYLYYQVYAPDGAIPVKTAYDPENPEINPASHIVQSVQRCLLKAEGFNDPQHTRTGIYLSVTSKSAEAANSPIAVVRPPPTHGATPENPLALVHRELLTPLEMEAIAAIDLTKRREPDPQYLYYQLFTLTGEDISTVAFDSSEPSIGRIEWKHLSPPRDSNSLKYHIAKIEGKPIYRACNLYKDIGAQAEFGTVDNPVVLVQPERRVGLLNRPAKIISTDTKTLPGSNATMKFFAGMLRNVQGTDFRYFNVFLCRTTNPQDECKFVSRQWLKLLDE